MTTIWQRLKRPVAATLGAGLLALGLGLPALADENTLDALFEELKEAGPDTYQGIENRIWSEWSESGSAAMDLLLQRGREALEAGEIDVAIEHFTALVDHAPDFAEAYNARATAYFQADLYGPSMADIRKTLELNPRHFGAMSGLALIFEEVGMKDGALEAYRAIADINPSREGVAEAIERLERELEGQAL